MNKKEKLNNLMIKTLLRNISFILVSKDVLVQQLFKIVKLSL